MYNEIRVIVIYLHSAFCSESNKSFLRESEATAANLFCAKAKRQHNYAKAKLIKAFLHSYKGNRGMSL
ncbi:hypothetical protein FJQ98_01095 [Lysinibacillus agricola]|uniref:Transposase n=1 Tax=Lysinibacillus agricola TaxID=2590012 RepID=A0ABX7ASF5_9BACI|nr:MULTISPECIES: hypothetical protein [Lysinibacillus]QQP12741.1 hypothetical protein FJQ98_01095 [Lysinibacillus agricola]